MIRTQTVSTQALSALHPVRTLMEEHRFILESLRALDGFLQRMEGRRGFADMGDELETLKGIAQHLVDAESHQERDEDVLFPRMDAHGAVDLPARMKADHAIFRAKKRRLYQIG